MVDINELRKLLPETYQKMYCFIFNEQVAYETRKERVLNYLSGSFDSTNWIKNINGHSAQSLIVHFINLDNQRISIKYSMHEEQQLHFVELFFHEHHHAYQVTYEGAIDTEVSVINHPLEIAADKFAKEQMILNKYALSELLGISEETIVQFATQIRMNKGAIDDF